MSLFGVDVSTYQKIINWDELKAAKDFVLIRASEGVGYKDPEFDHNRDEARRTQILRGFYHFARPDLGNSPEAEADFFLSAVGGVGGSEVLVLDFEVQYSGDFDDWCSRFLSRVEQKLGGYKGLLYINHATASTHTWTKTIAQNHGLWLALWDENPNIIPGTPWPVVALKQYSDKGTVNGIAGNVDLDVFFGDGSAFLKYGYQPAPVPQPTPIILPKGEPVPAVPQQAPISTFKIYVNHELIRTLADANLTVAAYNDITAKLNVGDNIELYDGENLIVNFTKPMNPPTPVITPTTDINNELVSNEKTIGGHLKSAGIYSATTMIVTTAIMVIINYIWPSTPFEVLSAVSTLLAISINLLLVYVVKKQ